MIIEMVFILQSRILFLGDLSIRPGCRVTGIVMRTVFPWTIPLGIDVSLCMEKVPIRFTYKHNVAAING